MSESARDSENYVAASGVYVDDSRILWRGKRWSHLYAESLAELLAFGDRIGLKRSWLQNPTGESGLPHFDVTGVMRERAVEAGAIEVTGGDGTYTRLRRALTHGDYPMETSVCGGSGTGSSRSETSRWTAPRCASMQSDRSASTTKESSMGTPEREEH